MLKSLAIVSIALIFSTLIHAQNNKNITSGYGHSHNDYLQKKPFKQAYDAGFGSIEADIFLKDGKLLVAHTAKELDITRTLEELYLKPLQQSLRINNGTIYGDSLRVLQLLIDIKTEAITTLDTLIELLTHYPDLISCKTLRFVITGNRPLKNYNQYPSWLLFDGDLATSYNLEDLKRVALFSDNFKRYSSWNGIDIISETDRMKLDEAIATAHLQHKRIRFWNAPDNRNAWCELLKMNVDFINTDHIEDLSQFIKNLSDCDTTPKGSQ